MPPPRMVLCYLCGKEFGSSSISIHETQCAKTFLAQQELLPPNQRKPLPPKPEAGEGATLAQRNEAAQEAYEEQVMVPCPGCGRTFSGQDRMQIHMKGCKAAQAMPGNGIRDCMVPAGASAAAASPAGGGGGGGKSPGGGAKPKAVLCFICGKEFGTTSISIHEVQCAKKFEAQQALLPEGQRKPLPTRPDAGEGAT